MIGSIIFVKTSSPFSWIIQKLTRSSYSHCCLSLSELNEWIVEVDSFKRVYIRRNLYTNSPVVDFELTQEQRTKLIKFVLTQLNLHYDYLLDVGIGLKILGFIKNLKWWDKADRTICSLLVRDAFSAMGVHLCDEEYPTPADLARALKVSG